LNYFLISHQLHKKIRNSLNTSERTPAEIIIQVILSYFFRFAPIVAVSRWWSTRCYRK